MTHEAHDTEGELPQELLDQLSKRNTDNMLGNLQHLFADGQQRSIDETLIDYWKRHKKVIKRTTMASALADLAKRSKTLRRCGKGVYVLNTQEDESYTKHYTAGH